MAVPARKTSKAKKNRRRGNQQLKKPAIRFDNTSGSYTRSHHVSLKEYLLEKPINAKTNG
jgi:large subunit ribosomal protein L32